ncbi:hypothetical protein EDB85DRAFT_2148810 [Lactarius pseudohatsudake]|nr:hypothetical protein EDB85DRAFT_2148810 [Lactarius pseudohatsudake]
MALAAAAVGSVQLGAASGKSSITANPACATANHDNVPTQVQSPDGGTPNNSYRTCGKSDGEAAGTFNHSSNSERPDDDDIDNGDDGGGGGSDNNDGDDTTVNGDTTDNDGDTTGDDGDDTTDDGGDATMAGAPWGNDDAAGLVSSALYNLISVSTQSHPALDFFPHPSEGSRSRKCSSSRTTGTHTSSGSPASSASGSNGVTVVLFSRILGVVFSVVFFA